MKLWHTALFVVLIFACIWASNNVPFINKFTS
jgi:hypothetical protein